MVERATMGTTVSHAAVVICSLETSVKSRLLRQEIVIIVYKKGIVVVDYNFFINSSCILLSSRVHVDPLWIHVRQDKRIKFHDGSTWMHIHVDLAITGRVNT